MTERTQYKICTECKVKVSLAYGNIDGRHWFCVDCLVKSPLRADVGLLDMYYRYSTPYFGFPQLTKQLRHKMGLDPRQFKARKDALKKEKKMPREIPDAVVQGDFPPMVGLRNLGNYVKGTVTAIGTTTNGNPVVTLKLIDLEGSTSISKSKGVYEEVEVAVGDSVQVVGSHKRLKEKLPQLQVGDVVTITNKGKTKLKQGQARYEYSVIID